MIWSVDAVVVRCRKVAHVSTIVYSKCIISACCVVVGYGGVHDVRPFIERRYRDGWDGFRGISEGNL